MALIIPEVFADTVNENFSVRLRAANLATDYTDEVDDLALCGDTVHFPTFDEISDASVVTKGTPITPATVNSTDSSATIQQVGHAVRIYDRDAIQVKGKTVENMAKQLAFKMAKAVDADLVSSLIADAAYKDATLTTLTAADIDAAFDVFGDDVDNDTFAGMLINSRLRSTIQNMDEFINSQRTNVAVDNGIVRHGLIGFWNGTIPVYVSDNGTYDSTNSKSLLAIVKKGALGIAWQKVPEIEESREALLRATDIVVDELYAAKLIRTDGASVLQIG